MSAYTYPAKAASKASKKSKIVVLRLSPDMLAQFSDDASDLRLSSSAPIKTDPSPSAQPSESASKSPGSNATPIPSNANDDADMDPNHLAPPGLDGKKKKGGISITGKRRAPPSIDPNAPPRERARPGPKKKPRLPDGTIDRSNDAAPSKKAQPAAAGPGNTGPGHKLGPKANTGAINAGLRALDRSGKPCRRWERRGLALKSFTGAVWGMSTWKAPERTHDSSDSGSAAEQDVAFGRKSESTGSTSEVKAAVDSSAVGSERSAGGFDLAERLMLVNGLESSPVPAPVAA